MQRLVWGVLLLLVVLLPGTVGASPTLQFDGAITSPRANAVLRGPVAIEGIADHPEFWKYEIRVAAGQNPGGVPDDQWTRVLVREQRVAGGQLAVWDTTRVPDGVYTLRLRVVRLDGNWQDFDVLPLNVANVGPPTPSPIPASPTPAESPTPEGETPTPLAQATPSTPLPLATLTPSGAASPPAPLATAITGVEGDITATPIIIDQPTIIIPTVEGGTAAGGSEGATPVPPSGDGGLTLPTDLAGEFDVNNLTSACLTGAAFTMGIFLLVGALFLLKSLFRLFR